MKLNGHVHRNAQSGVNGALHRMGLDHGATALVSEQVDGVRGMVPQQVVGPAAGLTGSVHVGAAEKVGLHIHLLNVQLA